MKTPYFFWLFFLIAISTVAAQTRIVTGLVKDNKGKPIHFVFVSDNSYKEATFTDSLGNFFINVRPDSKLAFVAKGYNDTLVSINNNNANVQVTLEEIRTNSMNASGSQNKANTMDIRRQLQRANDVDLRMMPGHVKGNLRGNRYLFDNFVHGYIINPDNQPVYNQIYLLNYDKISGLPVLTDDNENILQFSWEQLTAFTLFTRNDTKVSFVKEPLIDNFHFVQVLSSGKKYKIYKLIKTKFVKADYVNSGVISHGNDYDEYVDDADYYILDVQSNKAQRITLKKKSIKEGFPTEADKVNKYLTDAHGSIDDEWLSKLGNYMNQ